jgi:hypothetical protein
VSKKRQQERSLKRARRESMRRHPSFVEEVDWPIGYEPLPAWWMFPTMVLNSDEECPICAMLGLEIDGEGIHHREDTTGKNVPVQREGQALRARPPLDQSPAVTGEIYVEDVS